MIVQYVSLLYDKQTCKRMKKEKKNQKKSSIICQKTKKQTYFFPSLEISKPKLPA